MANNTGVGLLLLGLVGGGLAVVLLTRKAREPYKVGYIVRHKEQGWTAHIRQVREVNGQWEYLLTEWPSDPIAQGVWFPGDELTLLGKSPYLARA